MSKAIFLPEWAPQSAVLLSLPHDGTDWAYMLPQVHECYISILRAMIENGVRPWLLVPSADYATTTLPSDVLAHTHLIECEYNDTWIRDYGPLSLIDSDNECILADFGFNGWGLKFASDKDHMATHHIFGPSAASENVSKQRSLPGDATYKYRNYLGYVLEGGSVETDGNGTLLTTTRCLCSPCRNGGLSKPQVQQVLSRTLGVDHFLWLDHGALAGDDTDSHIDTLARLAPNDTIIYVGCSDASDEHFTDLQAMKEQLQGFHTKEGLPYNLIELPLPAAIYDSEDGHRLPATYANYLVTNHAVFMPVYGQPRLDELACRIIRIAYPQHAIVPVDCQALIRQHGSLHCATMQLYQ